MIATIAVSLWRQRLASPMRLVLLAGLMLPPFAMGQLGGSLGAANAPAFLVAMVLAAGAIGQEVSSGVLQLTFARPLPRSTYVIGRWLGAAGGGAALALAQLLVAAALLAARGHAPVPLDLAALALEDVAGACAGAAVLIGISAFVNGLADVGIYLLAFFTVQLWEPIARSRGAELSARVAAELHRTLQPELSFAWIAGHGDPVWTGLVTALSTTVLALALAIVAVNRKELSYAAD